MNSSTITIKINFNYLSQLGNLFGGKYISLSHSNSKGTVKGIIAHLPPPRSFEEQHEVIHCPLSTMAVIVLVLCALPGGEGGGGGGE